MNASGNHVVRLTVHHGNYREEFYGSGATLLAAAEDASQKTTYALGLFDRSDSYYERRAEYRAELLEKLEAREEYRGFGWNTYARVA